MIAFVKGILDSVSEDKIVVENQNIGFEILVPGSVVSELPQVGNTVKIYTYTYVREDALQLYGFLTKDSMDMFKLLITVNGIGPKAALGILTAMDTDALRLAILSDDAKTIAKAPGIGPKTASKLILELKDKCHLEDVFGGVEESLPQKMYRPEQMRRKMRLRRWLPLVILHQRLPVRYANFKLRKKCLWKIF